VPFVMAGAGATTKSCARKARREKHAVFNAVR